MSEVIRATLFRRMRHTPMRDALCGRITGRLDIERRLEAAGLPAPARELIRRITRRTRLWRIEKADVAGELIAHFADGLAEGEAVEEMIARFGDERAAAKLVRRAKRRNRGIVWHAFVALRWLACGLLVLYGLSAAWFYAGKPTVKVNYVERFNSIARETPASQLAWPLYREAIPQLRFFDPLMTPSGSEEHYLLEVVPGEPRWPEVVKWLKPRQDAIERLRQGAKKPVVGFVYGPEGSADEELWQQVRSVPNPFLMDVLQPRLEDLLQMKIVLKADTLLAHDEDDLPRMMGNIEALLGVADQLAAEPVLLVQYIGIGFRYEAIEVIEGLLARPDTLPLPPKYLHRLAHLLAEPDSAAQLISFDSVRMTYHDLIQRIYTDDGHGDGRLTPEGMKLIDSLTFAPGHSEPNETLRRAWKPLSPIVTASRHQVLVVIERMMNLADANLAYPMREANWSAYLALIRSMNESEVERLQFGFPPSLLPALDAAQRNAELYLGRRDGLLIALALELHRQRHGNYPVTLDPLVPALLPSLPVDRITGGPLRYRIENDKPLIYSLGADRDDDGGRPQLTSAGHPSPTGAARWNVPPERVRDGDWVLFPQGLSRN
ncbi:MAG: hypothetical protein WBD40_08465 [Tepidisphaeraceae bacterium]